MNELLGSICMGGGIFVIGGTLGVLTMALCVSNSTSRTNERITDLRVALGDLVRAVDAGNWKPYRDTETGRTTLEALEQARKVLEQ